MQIIISRKAARAAGLSQYFTGKPCPQGHIAPRIVSNYWCVKCRCETARKRRRSSPERRQEWARYRRLWRRATPERRKADNRYHHEQKTSTLEGRLVRQLRTRLGAAIRGNFK